MEGLATSIIVALLITAAYVCCSASLSERSFQAFAKSHGCAPIHQAQDQKWPWGLDRLYAIINAERNDKDILDDYMAPPLYERRTLERNSLGSKMIETIEPAIAKAVLSTNSAAFALGTTRRRVIRPVEGPKPSVFTADGTEWHQNRKMLRSAFVKERLNVLEDTERVANLLFEILESGDEDGWTDVVHMDPLVSRFVLDTSSSFLLGQSVEGERALDAMQHELGAPSGKDQVTDNDPTIDTFADSFDAMLQWLFLRNRLRSLVFLGTGPTFRKVGANISTFVSRAIDRHLKDDKPAKQRTQTSVLADLAQKTSDVDVLRAQITGLFLAGRDATSSLILLMMLLLSRHPDIYRRLRKTTLEKFGQPTGTVLDFEDLQQFMFLRHVMNEALRLCCVIPVYNRIALEDTVLPVGGGEDGTQPAAIRKGQQIQFNLYAMHRRKDIWGEDAHEFNPDRWQDPKRSALLEDGWAFIPFSRGPRVCVRQQYAMITASYCLVRFTQRYDVVLPATDAVSNDGRLRKAMTVALAPAEVKLRLHRAPS